MAGGEFYIDDSSGTNSNWITFDCASASSTTFTLYYDGENVSWGNDKMDPLVQMKQDFEALANMFFQEKFDKNFVGFPTPPNYQLDKLMSMPAYVPCLRNADL
jgi:hypothetical protein